MSEMNSVLDTEISGLRCSVLSTLSALETISEEWGALLSRSASNEFMQGPIWVINWWRNFGDIGVREICFLTIRRGETLIGIAPFYRQKVMHLRALPIWRLELMGVGEKNKNEVCSESIGLIAARGEEQCVANVFGLCLRGGLLGRWDEAVMSSMNSEAVITSLTADALGLEGSYRVQSGAPFVRLPSSWEEYLLGMSPSRRDIVKRMMDSWEVWAGEPPALKHVTQESELEQGLGILAKLNSTRENDMNFSRSLMFSRTEDFYGQVLRDLLRAGALRLCWMTVKGKPVAALLNIEWNNQVRSYQCRQDVGVLTTLQPDLVAHCCAIRDAIERGLTRYDFLSRLNPHKMILASEVQPLVELGLRRTGIKNRLKELSMWVSSAGRNARNECQRRGVGV